MTEDDVAANRGLQVISRKEARGKGLVHYYTGKPCKYGHVARRLVSVRTCVECSNEYMRKRVNAADGKWKEYAKKYAEQNKDRLAKARLVWQRANKEYLYAMGKLYREANPEKTKAVYRESKKRRRAKATADERARQARKINAQPKWVDKLALQAIYEQCARVSDMIGIKYHVDHIVPLQGKTVCGLHVPWNLQIIPAWLNMRKGNRLESGT